MTVTDALPSGYHAQPAWGFHDPSGRFAYELHRVYGPMTDVDARGPICRIDEGMSFWSVTWPTSAAAGDQRPAGRQISYAAARKLRGSHLTFERFSSEEMRDELPRLLHVSDDGPAPAA